MFLCVMFVCNQHNREKQLIINIFPITPLFQLFNDYMQNTKRKKITLVENFQHVNFNDGK